jgi:hypothetical protein
MREAVSVKLKASSSSVPPTLTLPLQGGGKLDSITPTSPSPLRGEGRGGGDLPPNAKLAEASCS